MPNLSKYDEEINSEGSTLFWTTVNLIKLCIGNGVLALPYSAYVGGVLFSPIGLAVIALWNVLSASMMVKCKYITEGQYCPPGVLSTFSKVSYSACGWIGAYTADMCILLCLLGACMAFQITFSLMLSAVPILSSSHESQILFYTYLSGILVYPVSCAKNVSFLSPVSLAGLVCLMIGLVTITMFGLNSFGFEVFSSPVLVPMFPESTENMSTFMGIAIFSYGLCVMVFPIEESMKKKSEFFSAACWSCIIVTLFYILVGVIIAIIFSHDPQGVHQNILVNLPMHSEVATIVRVTFALICLLSYPLLFFAPAQIVEQFALQLHARYFKKRMYGPVPDEEFQLAESSYSTYGQQEDAIADTLQKLQENGSSTTIEPSLFARCTIRGSLIFICTIMAARLPCFGTVLSLLGCFSMTILTFVLPPIVHAVLVSYPDRLNDEKWKFNGVSMEFVRDVLLCIVGVVICVGATTMTAIGAYDNLENGGTC